jgi:Xaa-Pro dipeptidase
MSFLFVRPSVDYKSSADRIDQEANFNYLSGCLVADASLFITFSSTSDIRHHLFIPPADPLVTMWSVAPPTLEEARAKFDSDAIEYTTDLETLVSKFSGIIHTLPATMEFPPLPSFVDKKTDEGLRTVLHIARMEKTDYEIELIREANRISSGAHEVLMRELGRYAKKRVDAAESGKDKERTGREGITEWEVESEGDAEALFVASCRRMG